MTPNKAFSFLVAALLVSVLLNLFLVGAGATLFAHKAHRAPPFAPFELEAPHGDLIVGWMARHLEPVDADVFQEAYETHADSLKDARNHLREAAKDLATAFQEEKPNAALFEKKLKNLNEARLEAHDSMNKILAALYSKMSVEGRRRLATLTEGRM